MEDFSMDIQLEKWSVNNKIELMNICNNVDRKYVTNRLPYPYTEEDADWWVNMTQEQDGREGIFRAIIADGEYVGNISVEKKSDVYEKCGEVGYLLLTEKWSNGITSQAVKMICEIAFEKLDIIRITGCVYEPNKASRKVLEKNGFSLEGVMKNAVSKNGNIYDLCVYGKCI